MTSAIPVTIIITTKNEERTIASCLKALSHFEDVIVVDSDSTDRTCAIALEMGAKVVPYHWDGRYPKKRQWCLNTLNLKHDWVFFVDADEHVTLALIEEIRSLRLSSGTPVSGYFVRGLYVINGTTLRHGLSNNKLCLINRHKMKFPVINDLHIPGMGEIEGHYQPVLTGGPPHHSIKHLRGHILHYAMESQMQWTARHERYAQWEAHMSHENAWPADPRLTRRIMKKIFKSLPLQAEIAFLHSYVLKRGFLDGRLGYKLARSRHRYYRMIRRATQALRAR